MSTFCSRPFRRTQNQFAFMLNMIVAILILIGEYYLSARASQINEVLYCLQ